MEGQPVIRELTPEVIDQIAAGEVVERPASVVKELVENSLDAGATHITIDIESGGKRLVRVLDNGCGLESEEIDLALRRHATSKLSSIDDLFRLTTMGFRGEALASIAAVSRLRLTSRRRGSGEPATLVAVDGGTIVDRQVIGAPVGTCIEVRDLMFNVPARLKFLKGDATETSHITDCVTKLALAHPGVHFRLRHGSRTSINAPLHRSGLERARAVLGSRLGKALHSVRGEENGIVVTAYLAAPELAQSTSRGLQLFAGRRPVRDRGLLHAVAMGYGELIAKGRYPVAVVTVEVPDPDVDVNVHPQKLEVRFANAQAVYAAVRHTIARGVAEAPWFQHDMIDGPAPVRMHVTASRDLAGLGGSASGMAADYANRQRPMLMGWGRAQRAERPRSVSFPLGSPAADATPDSYVAEGSAPTTSPVASADLDAPAVGFFAGLRYIGQLDRTYLVCERLGEMVLVDQHAAHERVAFQRLKEGYGERAVPVQRLLFPRQLELDQAEAAVVGEAREQLMAVGFELEPFGGTTWALKSVPAELRSDDPVSVLRELISDLNERGASRALEERIDMVFATIACHSVVRAGDVLSPREVDALFVALDGIDLGGYCPHGRPVLLRMNIAEIARRFGR